MASSARTGSKAMWKVMALPNGPWPTPDPFLFCAYHDDKYPAGDDKMRAPRSGNGADFDWRSDYRMYHGERIPGFPRHPHRGFETMTAVIRGNIDHADSIGACGRYGDGDLQWMTAGGGIVHGEMFPLLHNDEPNPLQLFQIWLNLPSRSKMVDPYFTMHWREDIPKVTSPDGKTKITVWAGDESLAGVKGLTPPPDSWASESNDADVAVLRFILEPGASFDLPPAAGGASTSRQLYFYEGDSFQLLNGVMSQPLTTHSTFNVAGETTVTLHNPSTSVVSEVLLLQGKPIGEPVAQHGPFVMNTQAEIKQCFADYQRTGFGGWPWPKDEVVFPREQGRFAKAGTDEPKMHPPHDDKGSKQ